MCLSEKITEKCAAMLECTTFGQHFNDSNRVSSWCVVEEKVLEESFWQKKLLNSALSSMTARFFCQHSCDFESSAW